MLKGLFALLVIVNCMWFSSFALADENTEKAKILFEKAKELYNEQKFEEAADTFRKSYADFTSAEY